MKTLRLSAILVFVALCAGLLTGCGSAPRAYLPRYKSGNEMVRPQNYQEWIYLTSGLHMGGESSSEGTFTNIYVTPAAYYRFLASGRWPENTVFIEEKRNSSSRTNKADHWQTDLVRFNAQVKDSSRYPEKWAFFSFGYSQETAKPNARTRCFECHFERGAVETTFVQLFPTLRAAGKKFGTYLPDLDGPYAAQY
jgi:hypothetical protein